MASHRLNALTPRKVVPLLMQSSLTPREITLFHRQVGRQLGLGLTIPRALPEATYWKTTILNELSIYLVNL